MTEEKTTWTREEMIQIMNESIQRDRMVSFLTAAINWGVSTGMAPQILDEGRRMLGALTQPAKPQEPQPQET